MTSAAYRKVRVHNAEDGTGHGVQGTRDRFMHAIHDEYLKMAQLQRRQQRLHTIAR